MPTAGLGSGSVTSAAITPANSAKQYQACWDSPVGGESMASKSASAIGNATRHQPWKCVFGSDAVVMLVADMSGSDASLAQELFGPLRSFRIDFDQTLAAPALQPLIVPAGAEADVAYPAEEPLPL